MAGFELPARLDAASALTLRETFLKHDGEPLVLRAEAVEQVDACGLQVLVAAYCRWGAAKTPFAIEAPSDAFRRDAALLGAPAPLIAASSADASDGNQIHD